MKKIGVIFIVLLVSLLAGCLLSTQQSTETVAEGGGGRGAIFVGLYKLRELDPLLINLLGIPEEKQLEAVIDEAGNITLPYVQEPVPAAGLTTSELEHKIRKIYMDGEIYRDITINIQTDAKIYYVEGEVRRPQEYVLNRRITLLQAIAASGDYTEYANRSKVSITRNGQVMIFNAKNIEKHPDRDVAIEAGDRIKVHRAWY